MERKIFGMIYLIWNMVNGKRYVGQTTQTVEIRFNQHASCKKYLIGKAIHKYGKENFRYGVIKSCATRKELNYWEMYFIAVLKSKTPYGYNRTDGGEGGAGCVLSEETIIKRSEAHRGENNGFFGKHHTNEFCINRSILYRGDTPYKNLLSEMDERKITYTELARLLGITQSAISFKMTGKRNFTNADRVKLEEIFGKPAEYLLPLEECINFFGARRGYSPYQNLLNELYSHQLTYAMLAELLGLSLATVSQKMRGEHNFTEKDVAKLVKIFDKPIEYLLPPEAYMKKADPRRSYSPYQNLLRELDICRISYHYLATLLNMTQSAVSRKMHGEYNFTERDKTKLVEIFGKPIEYLLERNEG
ncbi:MAG: helix-turn-helix domain-containing protein [Selenomonadaceae bacterium]|nr:helix-turn-helix domain-containing protein [Selenomonadaceae bacterium]